MKYQDRNTGKASGYQVAPLVGAWIEILCGADYVGTIGVAPLVGAWIEIQKLMG